MIAALGLISLWGCGGGSPPAPTPSGTDTIRIVEQYWDASGSCWQSRDLDRPAADWPTKCDETLDTGNRWAYDLYSDADGNCARFPIHCEATDAFLGPCEDVAGCCDEELLTHGSCPP